MTELEAPGVGEHPPPYMIFLVVFLFFLTGLLGFLICHLLKKKGYHCRTRDIDEDEEEEEKIGGNAEGGLRNMPFTCVTLLSHPQHSVMFFLNSNLLGILTPLLSRW